MIKFTLSIQKLPLIVIIFPAAFYYTLANISPRHRSSLKMIQLVSLVKSVNVSSYGVDKILQPFMEDIAKLEVVSEIKLLVNVNSCIHNVTYQNLLIE